MTKTRNLSVGPYVASTNNIEAGHSIMTCNVRKKFVLLMLWLKLDPLEGLVFFSHKRVSYICTDYYIIYMLPIFWSIFWLPKFSKSFIARMNNYFENGKFYFFFSFLWLQVTTNTNYNKSEDWTRTNVSSYTYVLLTTLIPSSNSDTQF